MADIIAIVNQKGGVGKTTTTINVGACLAAAGYKTLLIDADAQGNTTSGLGISKQNLKENFYHFLMHEAPLEKVLMEGPLPDLFIIPSNRDLLGINQELISIESRELLLKRAMDRALSSAGADKFDFIIIDSPPNLDLLSVNIMATAGKLIIPTLPEYLSLEGLADLLDTYKRVRETINPRLSILGVLITKHSSTNNLSKEVTADLRRNMGNLVFETVIPQNVRLAEAPSHCQPIILYDPKSSGSLSYQAVTLEIIKRCASK
jgi:ATPases involved in chromosome partitioning